MFRKIRRILLGAMTAAVLFSFTLPVGAAGESVLLNDLVDKENLSVDAW